MVEMKLRIVIALGLALGLVAVNVTAQVPVETERYPAPSEQETSEDYGLRDQPVCPDGSNPKFWGVFSDSYGREWNIIYRCVVQ